MKIKCGCKVNLYLQITNKRENGYHDVDTIFLPLNSPYDILKIKKYPCKKEHNKHKNEFKKILAQKKIRKNLKEPSKEKKGILQNIVIKCDTKGIDLKNNTLTKAYALYSEATNFAPKLFIELKKSIPHGAGLGGGSSNAAHLLQYLQKENKKPLSQKKLIKIASRVGADVPFFLYNIPCHARGIGEILTPISLKFSKKQNKSLYLVLISPYQSVSTKEAFENLDKSIIESKKFYDPHSIKKAISQIKHKKNNRKSTNIGDFSIQKKALTKANILDSYQISCFLKNLPFVNDFEKNVFALYPFMGEIKKILLQEGAFKALMSGTGSSIFGIFEKKENAKKAASILKKHFLEKKDLLEKKQTVENTPMLLAKKVNSTKIRVYPPLKIL